MVVEFTGLFALLCAGVMAYARLTVGFTAVKVVQVPIPVHVQVYFPSQFIPITGVSDYTLWRSSLYFLGF